MTDDEKYKRMYRCLNNWLQCAQEEKYLSDFLKEKGVSSVGIYGYGILGKDIVRELTIHEFPILWVADRRDVEAEGGCVTYLTDRIMEAPQPDMIVIATVTDTETIEKTLQGFFKCQIVTIEELVECVSERGNGY
jgi:hypothetical protein